MAYQIIWSAFAEEQIDAIFEYYRQASGSYEVANRIINHLISAPDRLISHPRMGPREPLLRHRPIEYRFIIVSNYKIIYSLDDEKQLIRIADVFDTRLDPQKIRRAK